MHLVDRYCREISAADAAHSPLAETRLLSECRNLPAYVLLGDPGAGKTTAFEQECARLGEDGVLVSARDFLALGERAEWRGKTLFIDGLDEIRAGAQDARTPFDTVRGRLDELGRPRFRLSCRGADWLGSLDRDRLTQGWVSMLRLEPLTEEDIRAILTKSLAVEDAGQFIEQAERKGLLELLFNPQTLGLLAKAAATGAWPETRRETFELACRKLIAERNPEHQAAADPQRMDLERNLRAAGFLCAVQIIAGRAGYALNEDEATEDFPWLGELSDEDSGLFTAVVRSRLFKSSGNRLVAPVHRHLAEYLAARCLAGRIKQSHLPAGRILASITGGDGMVVSRSCGLSAWLATLCANRRDLIIDRDPIGVALYGDAADFSTRSRLRLLNRLREHAGGCRFLLWPSLRSAPFPDMQDGFQLRGEDFPKLHDALLQTVRDPAEHLSLRRWCLGLLLKRFRQIQDLADDEEREVLAAKLKTLAEEIRSGSVSDSDGGFMGLLLFHLYPNAIPPQEIWDYLYVPHGAEAVQGDTFRVSAYTLFWECLIASRLPAAEVASCLDRISSMAEAFRPILEHLRPGWGARLVMRGLQEHGEAIDSRRLHQWLGVVPRGHEACEIQAWLNSRPVIREDLLDRYFNQCSQEENFGTCMSSARSLLFEDRYPLVFGRWCLGKFPEARSGPALKYLAEEAMFCHDIHLVPLPWEEIEKAARKNRGQADFLDEALADIKSGQGWRLVRLAEQDAEMHSVKSHKEELRKGDAPLALLHGLGRVFWGRLAKAEGATPLERLQRFLCHDQALIRAAEIGLRRSIHHPAIPSTGDIVQLRIDGKIHFLGPPVLAGLELDQEADTRQDLSDAQWRRACAFYLTHGENPNPKWYSKLAAERPEIVAEVLQTCVIALLQSNKAGHWTLGASLHALAFDVNWPRVAQMSAPAMLRAFPVRASKQQLAWLNAVLHAALRHSDQEDFLALIRRKAKLGSMNVGTRISWLAAGMLARPEGFRQRLADFVNSEEKRVRHLAGFCAAIRDAQRIPTPTIELLLWQIGEFYAPYKDSGGRATPAKEASDLIYRLLPELATRLTAEAADALARLSEEPKLSAWRHELQAFSAKQQEARREAEFHHLNVKQANDLLNNQQPANAEDLKALTEAVLQEVSDWGRNGGADDHWQYWNEGARRELLSPKHEEACRDALLSELRQHLARFGVGPERHLADDARADGAVSFGGADGFEVPIEIKKNTSPDLWRAMHDQLIAKYVRDPRADGCGLYVVLWFGADRKQPQPPQGAWPRSAAELETRLQDTLSPEEARKIAVCVVDVAAPERAGASP